MSRTLRPVDDAARPRGVLAHLTPIGDPPEAGPLDELSRARVRRLLAGFFGEFPTLDAHLALMDTRGAWYAERALGAWSASQPDAFFGVVRHVVRTQMPGPVPTPDVEGWLAAGRPDAVDLAPLWDELNTHRYSTARRAPADPRRGSKDGVTAFDDIVRGWPGGCLDRFVLAYASLEQVLERRAMVLPPIES